MSQYPTGPPLTTDPLVTSFDHPVLLGLYAYWIATGATVLAFVFYRWRRAWGGQQPSPAPPAQSGTPSRREDAAGPKQVGGFGGMKNKGFGTLGDEAGQQQRASRGEIPAVASGYG